MTSLQKLFISRNFTVNFWAIEFSIFSTVVLVFTLYATSANAEPRIIYSPQSMECVHILGFNIGDDGTGTITIECHSCDSGRLYLQITQDSKFKVRGVPIPATQFSPLYSDFVTVGYHEDSEILAGVYSQ